MWCLRVSRPPPALVTISSTPLCAMGASTHARCDRQLAFGVPDFCPARPPGRPSVRSGSFCQLINLPAFISPARPRFRGAVSLVPCRVASPHAMLTDLPLLVNPKPKTGVRARGGETPHSPGRAWESWRGVDARQGAYVRVCGCACTLTSEKPARRPPINQPHFVSLFSTAPVAFPCFRRSVSPCACDAPRRRVPSPTRGRTDERTRAPERDADPSIDRLTHSPAQFRTLWFA